MPRRLLDVREALVRDGELHWDRLTGWTVGLLGVREALLLNGALALLFQLGLAYRWRRAVLVAAPN